MGLHSGCDVETLFASRRAEGVEIYGQGDFVVAMRRSDSPLHFPLRLARSYPLTRPIRKVAPWGTVAVYVDASG
jgi:hypothetical protein